MERTLLSQQRQTASSPLVFMIPFIFSIQNLDIFTGDQVGLRAFQFAQWEKNLPSKAGDTGLIPWDGKIPWRRKWLPIPGFLPGEFHGHSLVGYSPWGCKELDMAEQTWKQAVTHHILYMWNLKYDTNKCAEPIIDTENKPMVTKREVGCGWYNLELTTRSNCIAQGTI